MPESMMMPLAQVDRDELMARYLANQLSASEAASFEAYWAEHPELTRDLEAIARLKAGLVELRTRGELTGVVRDRWWSRRLSLLAVAATLTTVCAGVVAWRIALKVESVALAPAIAALAPHASNPLAKGATYSLLRLRSSTPSDATIDLPAEPRAIELRVLPETESTAGAYVVALARLDARGEPGRPSATPPIGADPDGFVTVYVDSRDLEPGRYLLRIAPSDAPLGGTDGTFRLSVRAPDGA